MTPPSPAESLSRRLIWDACYNARDLGGLPAADGRVIREGVLSRSDHPGRLTADGRRALLAHGIRTVIDLRTPKELETDPPVFSEEDGDGVRLLHLPLFPEEASFDEELRATRSPAEAYRVFLDRCGASTGQIVTAIARAEDGGVLVHCYSGKDRTGVIIALILAVAGVSDEEIVADYALSDEHLRRWYEQILANTPDPVQREKLETQIFRAYPETMRATLEYLRERYGGAEGYLRQNGVSDEDLAKLRNRLR